MDLNKAKEFFEENNNYTILTHKNPDGDTLGCGFALVNFLRKMGKKANVINSDGFPRRYSFMYEGYEPMDFEEKIVVAVDVADTQLLGSNFDRYKKPNAIDFCIDHHISNTLYAKETLLDGEASSASLLLYRLFKQFDTPIDDIIAKCLYTGLATDTGCFRFENTTQEAHIAAGELMNYDINFAKINRDMFDVKSKARVMVEQIVTSGMEYFYDDRCAMITVSSELIEKSGIEPSEFDGLASIPLQVEGVLIAITVKQREEKRFRMSVRTTESIDASKFCGKFNGGGHVRAAGCEILGTLEEVKSMLLKEVSLILGDE